MSEGHDRRTFVKGSLAATGVGLIASASRAIADGPAQTTELSRKTLPQRRLGKTGRQLAEKSHDYTYDGTMALFDQTLKRLPTDHLDLYQHHMLGRFAKLGCSRSTARVRRSRSSETRATSDISA